MTEALKILESNELMRHTILFKLYIDSNGTPLANVDILKPIKELFAENFDQETYRRSQKYLHIKGYTSRSANHLTFEGLYYFEQWIKSFKNLSDKEFQHLENELPKPFFDFFKFSKESTTVLSFINQILKLAERF